MLKTISAALLAVSVLAAPALAGTPGKTTQAPDKITQAVEGGRGKPKRAERQCAGWAAIITSIIAIIATTSTSALHQDACEVAVAIKHVRPPQNAAEADPRARFVHIAPPRLADTDQPTRHCFPNGRGLAPLNFSRAKCRSQITEMRIPFRAPSGLRDGEGQGKSCAWGIGKIRGDPVAADRARGLRRQR